MITVYTFNIMIIFASIGSVILFGARYIYNKIADIGNFGYFAASVVIAMIYLKRYFQQFLRQVIEIGFFSLPVVSLTAIFSGAVLVLQCYTGLSRFSAEDSIASIIALSITRELGPVLAGLMVSGRIGASIAAEIATMKVNEQLSALETLAVNPFRYLFAPRLAAAIISLPILVLIADVLGIYGGYAVAVYNLDFNPAYYLYSSFEYLEARDIYSGLAKAAFFGAIIAMISCYHGYTSSGGAAGVGRSTTFAVVESSILILFANYLLTGLFF